MFITTLILLLGEVIDESSQFDSNCITPGTSFMAKVSRNLHFFLIKKCSEDEAYKNVTIIFSGHEVPGEGEHKIMEFIRDNRNQDSSIFNSSSDKTNLRHCLYGLDADLIMLSLVTHEPHFVLLREVVSYDKRSKGQPLRELIDNPTDSGFMLLHIGLLRDYLYDEFSPIAAKCNNKNINRDFKYDFERVIDDFVLLCMLVGNDFLPSLPTLDISEGALNNLIEIYKEMLPEFGYLTEKGSFAKHGKPFEELMKKIGNLELETLVKRAKEAESFAESKSRKNNKSSLKRNDFDSNDININNNNLKLRNYNSINNNIATTTNNKASFFSPNRFEITNNDTTTRNYNNNNKYNSTVNTVLHSPLEESLEEVNDSNNATKEEGATMMNADARALLLSTSSNSNSNEDTSQAAHALWRHRYYSQKLHIKKQYIATQHNGNGKSTDVNESSLSGSESSIADVVHNYLEALLWVLQYYYCGCCSWNWFYGYHYAPLASDIVNVQNHVNAVQFELFSTEIGRPFLPFEQLLSVLPAASSELLPECYRFLMNDEHRSNIIDFYPDKFDIDFEGKRADWEGKVFQGPFFITLIFYYYLSL